MHDYNILLNILLLSLPTLGSCILVFKKDNNVYVGADSRNAKQKADNTFIYEDNYCKIEAAGRYVFTFAGFDNASAHKIVSDALQNGGSGNSVFDKIVINIKRHYQEVLGIAQTEYPDMYQHVYSRGICGEIVIIYYQKDVVKLRKYDVKLDNNINDTPVIKLYKTESQPGHPNILLTLGISDRLKEREYEDVIAAS